jgi:hypothetical protein
LRNVGSVTRHYRVLRQTFKTGRASARLRGETAPSKTRPPERKPSNPDAQPLR